MTVKGVQYIRKWSVYYGHVLRPWSPVQINQDVGPAVLSQRGVLKGTVPVPLVRLIESYRLTKDCAGQSRGRLV